MKKYILIITTVFFLAARLHAQIGIGTSTPDASAQLHVSSTSKGLLIPQLTAPQRSAVTYTTVSGGYATAMGYSTTASGVAATAMGYLTTASGEFSTAMGAYTTASGSNSTAMGSFVNTNSQSGAFIIGDYNNTNTTMYSAIPNQMTMRFSNGYALYTNSAATVGVQVAPGGNSWSTISDINRKENFTAVKGDEVLKKIASFNLVSWNYKGQDAKQYRHYGPMAQEFYAAFGKDEFGTIGNDTTINQADFDGINLIAVQALEKRTRELQTANETVRKENQALQDQVRQQQKDNVALQQTVAQLQTTLKEQQNVLTQRLKSLEALVHQKSAIKETLASK